MSVIGEARGRIQGTRANIFGQHRALALALGKGKVNHGRNGTESAGVSQGDAERRVTLSDAAKVFDHFLATFHIHRCWRKNRDVRGHFRTLIIPKAHADIGKNAHPWFRQGNNNAQPFLAR